MIETPDRFVIDKSIELLNRLRMVYEMEQDRIAVIEKRYIRKDCTATMLVVHTGSQLQIAQLERQFMFDFRLQLGIALRK